MKYLFVICGISLVSFAAGAHAAPSDEFCKGWMESKANPPKSISFWKKTGLVLRLSFNKNSIVQTQITNAPSNGRQYFGKDELMILSTGVRNEAAPALSELQERLKTYAKLRKHLREQLKSITTESECVQLLTRHEGSTPTYDEMASDLEKNRELLADLENEKIETLLKSKIKDPARLQTKMKLSQLAQMLQNPEKPNLILFLHASEDGRLYDTDWNLIPNTLFQNLSAEIRTLAIYSCHPEAVEKRYQLKKLAQERSLTLVMPVLNRKVTWLLGESIPVALAEKFIKVVESVSQPVRPGIHPRTQLRCTLSIDTRSLAEGELGVFIDRMYQGQISNQQNELSILCPKSPQASVVTLQNMNLFHPVKWVEQPDLIQASIQGETILLRNHYAKDGSYIGSKSTSSVAR